MMQGTTTFSSKSIDLYSGRQSRKAAAQAMQVIQESIRSFRGKRAQTKGVGKEDMEGGLTLKRSQSEKIRDTQTSIDETKIQTDTVSTLGSAKLHYDDKENR